MKQILSENGSFVFLDTSGDVFFRARLFKTAAELEESLLPADQSQPLLLVSVRGTLSFLPGFLWVIWFLQFHRQRPFLCSSGPAIGRMHQPSVACGNERPMAGSTKAKKLDILSTSNSSICVDRNCDSREFRCSTDGVQIFTSRRLDPKKPRTAQKLPGRLFRVFW
jgi:hypothetical protein